MSKIPKRQYLNYFLLMFVVILIALICIKLYNYSQKNISQSDLSNNIGAIKIGDLDNTISEFAGDDFIYISYKSDADIQKFESKLNKIIVTNNLQNNFYYLDVSELNNSDNLLGDLNEKFALSGNKKIKNLPVIIYFHNGTLKQVLSSHDNKLLNTDSLVQLLDEYEIIEREEKDN